MAGRIGTYSRQTHEANANTTTSATPKPKTAIAKGSYAGILNITNDLPGHPKRPMILVAKSFISANIGRSKHLSSRDRVADSSSYALSARLCFGGALVRHYSFLQPSFRLTRYPIGCLELVVECVYIFNRPIRPFCFDCPFTAVTSTTQKMGFTIATPPGSPKVPTPTRQARSQ